jgi:dolichyl-phosphate beta-glucosyltransferase
MPSRLQLVVPCFNEAERLQPEVFLDYVAGDPDVAILFVDDGSSDATAAILADVAKRGGENVRVVTLPRNSGKGRAVQFGVEAAFTLAPEFVGYWDADLSTPLNAVRDFVAVFEARPDIDIVMGARVKLLGRDVVRSLARHYSGRVFATAASFALGVPVYDTQCGAKIFRATAPVQRVFASPFRSKWIFDVEILARYIALADATRSGLPVYELPLSSWRAAPGSKVRVWHGLRAMWDLVWIATHSARGRSRIA